MLLYLLIAGVAVASCFSLIFSSLTYSLRDLSRARLAEYLGRHDGDKWFDSITDHAGDLIFLTAIGRQLSNVMIWCLSFAAFEGTHRGMLFRYTVAAILAAGIAVLFSITIPHAAAKYASAELVGFFAPALHLMRVMVGPVAKVMHGTDNIFRRALGVEDQAGDEQIEQEIMSVVEEGEKEGVVGEDEREMIESVIEFRDTTAGQIMTARPEIVAIERGASLEKLKHVLEESGNSRIPVYERDLDHIVGILYARDLIRHLGQPADGFDMSGAMRPAFYVPETKPLSDLLNDFRHRKVHMAIVLDEYGGTAGLVTIEDILEELVGEISDEHEPAEPASFRRIDDRTAEVDARIYVDELNRQMDLNLPEDAGYDTLGGFLSTSIGRIPEKGTVFEHDGVKYTVLDAEPQKVNRVRVEVAMVPAEKDAAVAGS